MWALVSLGALLVLVVAVGIAVVNVPAPAKAILGLVGTGSIVLVLFLAVAIGGSVTEPEPMGGFSHAQLEADRVMTEQMAISTGSGMQSLMTADGMLARSADDAYVRALEQHVYQVDRMLGRVP